MQVVGGALESSFILGMEIEGLDGSSVNSCEIPPGGPGLPQVLLYLHVQRVTWCCCTYPCCAQLQRTQRSCSHHPFPYVVLNSANYKLYCS